MNYRGSISIFYSIVLLTLIVFCFSIVDFARIQIAQVQSTRAIGLATKSVMAEFDSQLALEYGLFGMSGDRSNELTADIHYYMTNSLSPDNALNNYDIRAITPEERWSFVDPEYVNKQIMNFMKLRGPYLALEEFMKEMDFFSKATKTAEIISLNNQVADQLSNINTNFTQLEKLVDGILFDEQQVPMSVNGNPQVYPNFVKKMVTSKEALENMNDTINVPDPSLKEAIITQVYSLPQVVEMVDKDMEEGALLGANFSLEIANLITLENNLSQLEEDLTLLNQVDLITEKSIEIERAEEALVAKEAQLSEIANHLKSHHTSIMEALETYILPLTGTHQKGLEAFGLLGIHESALEEVEWIQIQYHSMQQTLDELSLALATNKALYIEEVYTVIHDALDDYQSHTNYYAGQVYYGVDYYSNQSGSEGESLLQDIKMTLSSNIILLKTLQPSIETLSGHLENLPSNWVHFDQGLYDTETYNNMVAKSEGLLGDAFFGSQASEASIKSILKDIETNLEPYQTDIVFDYTEMKTERETMTLSEVSSLLETALGIQVPHFDTIIQGERLPSRQNTSSNLFEFTLPSEINLETGREIYEISQLIGNYFTDGLDDALNLVYLNEYILSTFSCFTDGYKKTNAALTGVNFKEHVFDTEIEYIIFGHPVAYKNLMLALGFIFLIRVVMNMMHIYMSPEKMKSITELATAVAGWWSFEIGAIPVAVTLVLIWSILETVVDLMDLVKGESVALLKNSGNWKTDMDGLLGETMDQDEKLADQVSVMWDYKDYLRVLLYLQVSTRETKVYRLLDLIQINLSHSRQEDIYLEDYCYEIKMAADIRVNPLFMELPFVPSSLKAVFTEHAYKVRGSYCYQ